MPFELTILWILNAKHNCRICAEYGKKSGRLYSHTLTLRNSNIVSSSCFLSLASCLLHLDAEVLKRLVDQEGRPYQRLEETQYTHPEAACLGYKIDSRTDKPQAVDSICRTASARILPHHNLLPRQKITWYLFSPSMP